jgi:uncharacterized membrane protein YhdT
MRRTKKGRPLAPFSSEQGLIYLKFQILIFASQPLLLQVVFNGPSRGETAVILVPLVFTGISGFMKNVIFNVGEF